MVLFTTIDVVTAAQISPFGCSSEFAASRQWILKEMFDQFDSVDFNAAGDVAKLPPQRRKVYEFVCAEVHAGESFPSREKIAAFMGWKNTSSATETLMILSGQGFLKRWRKNDKIYFEVPGKCLNL